MAKTKDELLALLQGVEEGDEYIAAFNDILKSANSRTNKAINKTAEELKVKVAELEKQNSSLTENYNKLYDFIGLPMDVENLDDSLEAIRKKQAEGGSKSDAGMASLKSQINELKRTLKGYVDKNESLEQLASLEKTKRQSMIRDAELRNALEKNKALNPFITAGLLRDKVKVLDDDSIIYTNADGTEVTVDEGVKSFLDTYPEYLANRQIQGAGSGYGGTAGKNVDFENFDPAEYRKLRAEGKI